MKNKYDWKGLIKAVLLSLILVITLLWLMLEGV